MTTDQPTEPLDLAAIHADTPCRCHNSHASLSPFHPGHCSFWPPSQNCHPAEVAAWETKPLTALPRPS